MLEKIKSILGVSDKDATLQNLIDLSTEEVKAYCDLEDVTHLESVIIQIVIFKFNQLNSLGISAENYSGGSFSYSSDYPPSITAILNRNRRCKVL